MARVTSALQAAASGPTVTAPASTPVVGAELEGAEVILAHDYAESAHVCPFPSGFELLPGPGPGALIISAVAVSSLAEPG